MKSGLKSVLVFVMHQFIGTWGVAFLAYFLGSSFFGLLGLFGWPYSMHPLHWILTETPYFPAQIILGLYLGWVLGRRFGHRSMVWVWVFPGLVLGYAVLEIPTLTPGLTSVLVQTGNNPLSHYFGRGCRAKDRCLDQILVTMPFYAATAYSIGAWLALTFGRRAYLRR